MMDDDERWCPLCGDRIDGSRQVVCEDCDPSEGSDDPDALVIITGTADQDKVRRDVGEWATRSTSRSEPSGREYIHPLDMVPLWVPFTIIAIVLILGVML